MTYNEYQAIASPIEADQGLDSGTLWKYTKSIAVRGLSNMDFRDLYNKNKLYFIDNGGVENLFTGFVILNTLDDHIIVNQREKDIAIIPLDSIKAITFELPKPYSTADEIVDLLTADGINEEG